MPNGTNNPFVRPTLCQSLAKGPTINTGLPGELSQSDCGSVRPINHKGSSSVVGLFNFGGPAAISWLVVAVIVDAIQAMTSSGGSPHVFEKRLVAVHPRMAYGYSSTSVSKILPAFFVIATRFHTNPSFVFLRRIITFSMAWLASPRLERQASAAFGVSGFQCAAMDNGDLTAIAKTVPPQKSAASAIGSLRYHSQFVKYLADQIYFFHRHYYACTETQCHV